MILTKAATQSLKRNYIQDVVFLKARVQVTKLCRPKGSLHFNLPI